MRLDTEIETRTEPSRESRRGRRRRRRRRRQQLIPIVVALLLIVIVALIGLGGKLFGEGSGEGLGLPVAESKEKADLNAYYGITPGDGELIILNHQAREERGILQNGISFVPLSMANEWEEIFYYDANENRLLATTAEAVHEAAGTDFLLSGDSVYVSMEWLKQFITMSFAAYESPSRLVIRTEWEAEDRADLTADTMLRTKGDRRAQVVEELKEGDTVTILSANELFSYAETEHGHLGYLDNKKLGSHRQETSKPAFTVSLPPYNGNTRPHSIVLGWHNIVSRDGNDSFEEAVSVAQGMNVISPTWFAVSDDKGNVADIASADYVTKAHAAGLEVWGLVDNMSYPVDSNVFLSHTATRQALEANLIALAGQYGLDGLNIDFEQLPAEAGDDFSQFLRELSILCRQKGLVLSVDNYVPKEYTSHYRRDIQGRVCDYVIIMGYDEHTNASGEAGSVASIDFVTEGIEKTLEDVPPEKVINGIPFYTRRWITESDSVDSVAIGMTEAQAFLKDNGQTAVWDEAACQNVAHFEKNGASYSIWLEDAQSISAKLSVMKSHDLAGVACWRLMLETPDIWEVIRAFYPAE